MPEEITDQEREELRHEKSMKKREMSIDEILECPTWDCNGGPEIVFEKRIASGEEMWKVWCPECRGWMSYFLVSEGQDPYTIGAKIWEEMRRGMGN